MMKIKLLGVADFSGIKMLSGKLAIRKLQTPAKNSILILTRLYREYSCLIFLLLIMLINKCRRCDCLPGRLLFHRKLQTITLRRKLFSVWIFMLSEMFSEETA